MTTSPPVDDVRLMMLKGIYKSGPSDDELIRLPDLVLQVSEFYGMVGPVSMANASLLLLNALLGYEDWAGKPPESLDLYHCTERGNLLVSAAPFCGCENAPNCGHLSPRQQSLSWLPMQIIMGRALAELGRGDKYSDSPPPRFLAVLRDEALGAFGVKRRDTAEDLFRRMETAGVWPRPKAEKGCKAPAWTDAEREAAFELRHLWGVSDVVLKDRIGLSRQRINEAIGGKTKTSAIQGARDGWKAPIELLRRCGFLVHEMTLQDARKPAPLSARKAA